MSNSPETRYSAPALEKGLDILEYLAGQTNSRSKTEIADDLERTPSEIYRMLCVLEQRGYVRKQPGTTAYNVSLKLFELGHLQSSISTLRKSIRQPMEQLANQIGQASHFSIQNGNELLVMMERMPSRRVCLAVGEGTVFPISLTASGQVLLSLLEEHEALRALQQNQDFMNLSAAKQKAYINKLGEVRSAGYLTQQSQLSPGVIDVALPVGIPNTDLSGALAVSILESDLSSPVIQRNLRAMQACAKQINQNLGI